MGGGIAMVYANAGIPVLLKEVSQEALEKGLARIRANYDRSVSRGRLTAEQAGGAYRPDRTHSDVRRL